MSEVAEIKYPQIQLLHINDLVVSPFNVRKQAGDLTDLKNSIKVKGLLQPILVRPTKKGYEVVVGQRRFLACKELEWKRIPAFCRKMTDREALAISLSDVLDVITGRQKEISNFLEDSC